MSCPRCDSDTARLDHEGKDGGKVTWRIFYCTACGFGWRDSEPASAIDPAKRDPFFFVNRDEIESLPVVLPPSRF